MKSSFPMSIKAIVGSSVISLSSSHVEIPCSEISHILVEFGNEITIPKEDFELPLLLTGSDMNVSLKDNVTTNIDGEELHMLVYQGDSNFTVIQKVCTSNEELEIIETNGDLIMTINGFAILEENKVSYTYNDVEIVIYGDDMNINAYFDVANGIEVSWSK